MFTQNVNAWLNEEGHGKNYNLSPEYVDALKKLFGIESFASKGIEYKYFYTFDVEMEGGINAHDTFFCRFQTHSPMDVLWVLEQSNEESNSNDDTGEPNDSQTTSQTTALENTLTYSY